MQGRPHEDEMVDQGEMMLSLEKRKKWSIVVGASKGYEPGLSAFLNSFWAYHKHPDIDVYVLGLELDQDFEKKYSDKGFLFVDLGWVKGNTAWSTKIPRFEFAAKLGGIVMLADADMFFCADISNWFRIAETGLIVAGANGSNFRFHEGWREKYKIEIPDFFDYKTITSVPTVMDVNKHGQVWLDLYKHKMGNGQGADFDLQNIFMTKHNKIGELFVLPSQQVTGIHHLMLKPGTRVIMKVDKLMTEDGLEVLMVHGKWWQPGWYDNLITKMEGYCKGNERCLKGAVESRQLLKEEFDRWSLHSL